jgi:release factor glutamine methyltransferase
MIEKLMEIYEELRKQGVDDPVREILYLADLISKGVLRRGEVPLPCGELDAREVARLRAEGRPMEYIVGAAAFLGELLECGPGALIPREETELLTLTSLEFIERASAGGRIPRIIELGTGSGNIAVLLALRAERAEIYASDISAEAIEVARSNVERCGVSGRVTLLCGDMYEPLRGLGLEGDTDLVVCNPPYIPSTSVEKMDSRIIDHEPRLALDAGAYGLDIFSRLIKGAPEFLRPGGMLAFEIGAGQDRIVTRLLKKAGGDLDAIGYVGDGKDIRVLTALRK